MTVPCDVIHDLLPLYYDQVCTDQTQVLVDQHLAGCAQCRSELADLDAGVRVAADPTAQAAPLRALARLLRRRRWLAFLLGVFTVSALGAVASLIGVAQTPAWVDADGLLHEPFALTLLAMLLGLIAITSGVAALIVSLRPSPR